MDFIPVYADTETCSECDLKKHGTHRYAEHPTTRIQLFSYAIGDGPVKLWSLEDGEPMPADLRQAFDDPRYIFWFHNAWFDRNVIEHCLGIHLPINRYRCAMALALSHALPAGLEKLGEVLGLPQNIQKIKDGKRLVQKFCKPRKQKDGSLKWATPKTDPDDWKRYKEYCITDTAAMKECIRRIPKWNYTGVELEYWFMDQTVNSRGMNIDIEFVLKAMDVIALNQKRLSKRTNELTNGEVQAASQRDAMLKYLLEQFNIELPDMRKATLQRLLDEGQLPPEVVELIELRLDTCTTSTAKYKKIANVISQDNRVRGTIQFAGASRTLRDCLAEGTKVLTLGLDGVISETPIELVKNDDLVWDGVEWVPHEGVIYAGEKEVIFWDGICATPDHMVYFEDGSNAPLSEARSNRRKLCRPETEKVLCTK